MIGLNPDRAFRNIAFDNAMQAAEQPRVSSKLIATADSVGVACEYQAFIVEKTLANKILTRDSYGVRRTFIVATETGILHQMKKSSPHKTFIPAPPNNSCACNDCPHMKLNTLEKLYINMKYEVPEITMDEQIRIAARKPIERMLEISKQYGL